MIRGRCSLWQDFSPLLSIFPWRVGVQEHRCPKGAGRLDHLSLPFPSIGRRGDAGFIASLRRVISQIVLPDNSHTAADRADLRRLLFLPHNPPRENECS